MADALSASAVIDAIKADDTSAVVDLFRGQEERERRSVAAAVLATFEEMRPVNDVRTASKVAAVAVVACATMAELRKHRLAAFWRTYSPEDAEVLIDRRPPWLADWVKISLETDRGPRSFRWTRQLLQAGVIHRPETDAYILNMIRGIGGRTQRLRADPDLLAHEVWRLFEVEGRPRWASLSSTIGSQTSPWRDAFLELAAAGDIQRDRVIDATLDALASDFSAYNLRWYFELYDALLVTEAERAARYGRYLRILRSREGTAIKFGIEQLEALAHGGILRERLAEAIGGLLATAPQATARRALKLLALAGAANAVVRAAAEGLTNPSPAVQEAAAALIVPRWDEADLDAQGLVRDRAELVNPSVRASIEDLVGSAPVAAEAGVRTDFGALPAAWQSRAGVDNAIAWMSRHEELRPLELDQLTIPAPLDEDRISPVADVYELIDKLTLMIERADDPEEIEIVLDGVSRFGRDLPADIGERAGPLRKRVAKLMSAYHWGNQMVWVSPEYALCHLVRTWLDGVAYSAAQVGALWAPRPSSMADFLRDRMLEVMAQIAIGRHGPLLATPTHRGGWIGAADLAYRVVKCEQQRRVPGLLDSVQALLRVSPWGRAEALSVAAQATSEVALALRHVLGEAAVTVGPTAELWAAASRGRDAYADDPATMSRHGAIGPGGGAAGILTLGAGLDGQGSNADLTSAVLSVSPLGPRETSPALVTVNAYLAAASEGPWETGSAYFGRAESGGRWASTVWPAGREVHYANGFQWICYAMDWDDAGSLGFLDPLIQPDEPIGRMARVLLVTAISAKSRSIAAAGTDVLVEAVADGRLVGHELGETLADLVGLGIVKLNRVAPNLAAVAATSSLHGWAVRRAIERGLALNGASIPTNMPTLLQVLLDLVVSSGAAVRHEGARAYLARVVGPSKSGKLAAELLKQSESGDADAAVARLVLAARVARAQRWADRAER
ncbi:MAG: DUF6493 family protein [Acidimicrobiales bacterium]